jgi:hypothetical protein
MERETIVELKWAGHKLSNFNDGGEGSANPALHVRAKMAAAKLGKPIPEERKRRISLALAGKPKSPAHVANVAAALKGRPPSAANRFSVLAASLGRRQTQEEKDKRAASNRGKKRSSEFCALMSRLAIARRDAGTLNFLKPKESDGNRFAQSIGHSGRSEVVPSVDSPGRG